MSMNTHAQITCPITGYSYLLPSPIPLDLISPHPITTLSLKELVKSIELESWTQSTSVAKQLLFYSLLSKNRLIQLPKLPNKLNIEDRLVEELVFQVKSLTVWVAAQKDISYLPSLALSTNGDNLKDFLQLLESEKRRIILQGLELKQLLAEKATAKQLDEEAELLVFTSRRLLAKYESKLTNEVNTLPQAIAHHLLVASGAPKVVYKYWFGILTKSPSTLVKWNEYNRNDCDELLEWFEQWDNINPLKIVAINHLRVKLAATPAPLTLDDLNILVMIDPIAEQSNETGETKDLATKAAELLARLKAKKVEA